jgi:hypothetical protein
MVMVTASGYDCLFVNDDLRHGHLDPSLATRLIRERLGAFAPGFGGQSASSNSQGGRLHGKYHPRPPTETRTAPDAG